MTADITIAGRDVAGAVTHLSNYLDAHWETIDKYDGVAGSSTTLTADLVAASRKISSRISHDEGARLIAAVSQANWVGVPPDARLLDADPSVEGGLYDHANALFARVRQDAGKRVADGKTSKVLYLMRPHLFPILDSRIRHRYSKSAADAAETIRRARPDFQFRRSYWGAIRNDLITNERALRELRRDGAGHASARVRRAAAELSDLRLLDLIAWDL